MVAIFPRSGAAKATTEETHNATQTHNTPPRTLIFIHISGLLSAEKLHVLHYTPHDDKKKEMGT
jgi:hypothetical protein